MAANLVFVLVMSLTFYIFYKFFIHPLYMHCLSSIPGPRLYALTKWRLAWDDWRGTRTRTIHALHQTYGQVVRVGPREVHFNSLSALRTIYGPGSGFGRTDFYRMFDVYGKQNLFTFHSSKDHGDRKKLLANAYSKSNVVKGKAAEMVGRKIQDYLALIKSGEADEIFTSLHYYSLDSITEFLYGAECGGTKSMNGSEADRKLIVDILDPSRRRLSWFAVHAPWLTKWLYSRTGLYEKLVQPLLPMKKPATYSGIRRHALKAMEQSKTNRKSDLQADNSIIGRLYRAVDSGVVRLDDLEIASEVADHLLAGIDTTSDTLMFIIWALSLPGHEIYQNRLIEEVRQIPDSALDQFGAPTVEAADKLPYLDAVIKETLRLYTPLSASEPRSAPMAVVIDGYEIPAETTVSMAPHSMHRNGDVFLNPLRWDPERWLGDSTQVAEMKKWWWAFSSGGRMCIGMQSAEPRHLDSLPHADLVPSLALAEMALVPAIYRKYRTRTTAKSKDVAPGITSRFEVFSDESYAEVEEHTCWIEFVEQSAGDTE